MITAHEEELETIRELIQRVVEKTGGTLNSAHIEVVIDKPTLKAWPNRSIVLIEIPKKL